ncbi:hypothetical protein D3C87_2061750 [compost metagenome]
MHKRWPSLPIRVIDLAVFLPFSKQEDLAPRLRGHFQYPVDVPLLHYKDQVRFIRDSRCQLASAVTNRTVAMFF